MSVSLYYTSAALTKPLMHQLNLCVSLYQTSAALTKPLMHCRGVSVALYYVCLRMRYACLRIRERRECGSLLRMPTYPLMPAASRVSLPVYYVCLRMPTHALRMLTYPQMPLNTAFEESLLIQPLKKKKPDDSSVARMIVGVPPLKKKNLRVSAYASTYTQHVLLRDS